MRKGQPASLNYHYKIKVLKNPKPQYRNDKDKYLYYYHLLKMFY